MHAHMGKQVLAYSCNLILSTYKKRRMTDTHNTEESLKYNISKRSQTKNTLHGIIPFIPNSKKGKAKAKALTIIGIESRGLTSKGHREFWGDGKFLHLSQLI